MTINSPFNGLNIPRELVCEFFATFARFEYAMKEINYIRAVLHDATPAWWRFAADTERTLIIGSSELEAAINYLNHHAPQIQLANLNWESRPLHGETDVSRAFDAVCRIRNNLFHGGKHTPHSAQGHDEALVLHALTILYSCLEQNNLLLTTYNELTF